MAITGPSLAPLQRSLSNLASNYKRIVLQNLAEEARLQVSRGFQWERDPYGKSWAPLRPSAKRRGGAILRNTGRLANSIIPRASGSTIRVTSNVKYAAAHNYGAKITHKGGVRAHGRGGGFISAKRASKRKRAVRVSFTAAHGYSLPRRQFLPSQAQGLGPIWEPAFYKVANRVLQEVMRK